MPRISFRKCVRSPVAKSKTAAIRRQEAYERLGVTAIEVESAPKIAHILNELPGKLDQAIEYLRGSEEPDARKWLGVYDSLVPAVRKLLPFEAFGVAANITSKRMLEIVTGACFEQSTAAAQLIAKAAHPALIKKSIKFASKERNWEDRKMLHQKEGFAPIPKTQVINVQGDMSTDNRRQSISILQLGHVDAKMKEIEDRFNEGLGLGDGSVPKQIEAVEVSDDASDAEDGRTE